MPSAGFEPAIPVIKRPQTYALDRTATGIGYLLKLLGWIVQRWVEKKLVPHFCMKNLMVRNHFGDFTFSEPCIVIHIRKRDQPM
jgi:hypothetical protein